jgi:hypothetical protein
MNREAQLAAEVQVLGTLCNGTGVREQRNELANILGHYAFLEPEHEIVFGSIRSLLVHDGLSNARLAVHLNNRGFPDVDLEKYCTAGLPSIDEALKLAVRLRSLTQKAGKDVRYDSQGKIEHEI